MPENQFATTINCGNCKHANAGEANFCEGCGQSLFEKCKACSGPVLLTQKFCSSCGENLEESLRARFEEAEQLMVKAVEAAKRHDYDDAISLLRRIAAPSDYRFKETAENAQQAIGKIEALRDQANSISSQTQAQALQAFENGDQAEAAKLLESLPAKLLSEESKSLLQQTQHHTRQLATLQTEVREALGAKRYNQVGSLLDQLLALVPNDASVLQLAEQVTARLVAMAKQRLQRAEYDKAAQHLHAVPRMRQDESIRKLLQSISDIHWLSEQFDDEPYATPMLGRLAVRFAKEVPDDPNSKKLVQKLGQELKQGTRSQRSHLPPWTASAKSWPGGDACVLALPKSIDLGDQKLLRTAAGRFNVAFGLALQGLGKGRIDQHFGLKKKGLFGGFRSKVKACWGVDIGSSAIKAVLLQEQEDGTLVATDSFCQEYEPSCRLGVEKDSATVSDAVAQFVSEKELEGVLVWANIAASELISRFLLLPPVKEKQQREILEKEIEQKFPVAAEDLCVVRWMSNEKEGSMGRPAGLAASKRNFVERRVEMLKEAGLEIDGLQADTLAVVNFADYEFASSWQGDSADEGESTELPSEDADPNATIALFDVGASATTVVMISKSAHWSWTIESGGEDLTNLIARSTKTTHAEAEKLKRNPADLKEPCPQYAPVETRLAETRVRLERVLADGLKQNSNFDVQQTWCHGGGCLALGWLRHVLLAGKK